MRFHNRLYGESSPFPPLFYTLNPTFGGPSGSGAPATAVHRHDHFRQTSSTERPASTRPRPVYPPSFGRSRLRVRLSEAIAHGSRVRTFCALGSLQGVQLNKAGQRTAHRLFRGELPIRSVSTAAHESASLAPQAFEVSKIALCEIPVRTNREQVNFGQLRQYSKNLSFLIQIIQTYRIYCSLHIPA